MDENSLPIVADFVKPKKILEFNAIKCALVAVIAILSVLLIFLIFNVVRYNLRMKNFRSFDLDYLRRQDLVVESIEFKKFVVQGTDSENKYTDELKIFHVSGRAEISFTALDSLKTSAADSDWGNGILRLTYTNKSQKNPFDVRIVIEEKDVQQVSSFESEKIGLFGLEFDLVRDGLSQAELLESVRSELKAEFENQVFPEGGKLAESEVYALFLRQLSQIVRENSDWKSVEIEFGGGI